MIVVVIVAT